MKSNTAEAGVAGGTIVRTDNSSFANAWDVVTTTTSTEGIYYSTNHPAHGTLGIKFLTSTASATAYVQWTLDGSLEQYARINYFHTQATPVNGRILQFGNVAGSCLDVELRTDNTIRMRDYASTQLVQTQPLTVGQPYRIEIYGKFQQGTGQAKLRIYNGWDTTSVFATFDTDTNANLRDIPTYLRFGVITAMTNALLYGDDFQVRNDQFPGPVVAPNVPPTVTDSYNPVWFGETATISSPSTDSDGGTPVHSWSISKPITGATHQLIASGTSATIKSSKPGAVGLTDTVTDGQGGTSVAKHIAEFVNPWWVGSGDSIFPSLNVFVPSTPTVDPFTLTYNETFDVLAAEGEFQAKYGKTSEHATKWDFYPTYYLTTRGQPAPTGVGSGDHYGGNDNLSVVSNPVGAGKNALKCRMYRGSDGKLVCAAPIPLIGPGAANGNALYGMYEQEMYVDAVTGYHIANLLWNTRNYLPSNDPKFIPWPQAGEDDGPEYDTNGKVGAFMHQYGGSSGAAQDIYTSNVNGSGQWFTFTRLWTPGRDQYLINGTSIGISTGSKVVPDIMQWILQNEGSFGTQPGAAPATCNVYYRAIRYSRWNGNSVS